MSEKINFIPNFEREDLEEKIKEYIDKNKVEIIDPETVMESLADEVDKNKGKYVVRGEGGEFDIYFFDKDNSINECTINLGEINCNRDEFDENMIKIGLYKGSDLLDEIVKEREEYLKMINE